MALLSLAVAGGVTYLAWKTVTPTAKWALLTVVVATLVDDVLFEESEFGPSHLLLSALVAGAAMGVM
jgi:hypothetical protein